MGILENKVVIVTGSSSGIGWAIAEELHNEGAKVVLHGQDEAQLDEKVRKLGKNATRVVADLMDLSSLERIVAKALEAFGQLDGLVNNAGIFPRDEISSVSQEQFDRIFAINTRAPLFMCKEAVRVFRKQASRGSIVNIGSINAHCGQRDILSYSMSKGALVTMTRNLGDALGAENIRVNQLNVGWTHTETEHAVQLANGKPENWLEDIPGVLAPTGNILQPENIAPHVAFWLSDKSWPVNGQVYEVEQFPVIGRVRVAEDDANG